MATMNGYSSMVVTAPPMMLAPDERPTAIGVTAGPSPPVVLRNPNGTSWRTL